MDYFIFSAIINAFIAGLLGFVVALKNSKETLNRLFLGIIISAVFWSISYWQWLSADNASSALFWVRLLSIGSLFIPVFYFHWVLVFIGLYKEKINFIKFIYLIVFIFFIFSFSRLFIIGVEPKYIFPFWPIPGIFYHFYLIFIYIGLFFYSLIILAQQYKLNLEPKKTHIKYIILGTLISLIGGSTNFFLWYNIPIFPYGNILVSVYSITLAIAILKHQLFNIKVIATELLTFTIWIAVLFELLIADTWKERLFEGGLLLFVIVFGILLIKSVLKEVHQREEMEKLSKELKVINEKLVETDKMKAGMYSFVSHQIKAPMGIVKGFAELLAQNAYGKLPKKAKETVENIEKAANRLIRLVEDFLDLRRIEEGRMDYEFKEINIVDLVKSVFEELKLLANQKKLEFIFNITTSDVVKVRADEQRLRQVIMNLIENAIKYTEKGFVKVECQMSDVKGQKSVLFSVSDSGIGIKPEVLPELFDQFKRAKEARLIQGTGLGLYIAREIVKAHGGEIWAESDGEGKGSGFYVRLKMNE